MHICICKITYRITGILLLEEVANTFGREGINAVVDAAGKRFHESQNEKTAGSPSWWRVSALSFSLYLYFFKGLTNVLFLTCLLTLIFSIC